MLTTHPGCNPLIIELVLASAGRNAAQSMIRHYGYDPRNTAAQWAAVSGNKACNRKR